MGSAPALITSAGSEPVSAADGDEVLTSTFSVSTATANTNVSTANTAPITSQVATKNRLSMMEKSIASLDNTLTRFIQGQKKTNNGTSGRQGHCSRSRHRDHYSYYRRSRSRSPQIFNKSSRHYYGYQHGGWSPSSELSLNASQSEIDDKHEDAPNIRMKMRRMSNSRGMKTMRMWVTCSLRTSKQLCQCLLQWEQTLQNQIC